MIALYVAPMRDWAKFEHNLAGAWTKGGFTTNPEQRFNYKFRNLYDGGLRNCNFKWSFPELFKAASQGYGVTLFINTDKEIGESIEKLVHALASIKYGSARRHTVEKFYGYTETYNCTPVEMLRIIITSINTTQEIIGQNILYKKNM